MHHDPLSTRRGVREQGGRRVLAGLAVAAAVVAAAGCGDDADDAGDGASVTVVSPEDGATVESPVTLEMAAENFVIEPAGEVREGAGHLHAMIDVPCVESGEVIPSDDEHIHYGDASTSDTLELEPGEYTVCVQAGDGVHTALDLTDTVTFTVSEPG
jgi:hypothetical protein